VSIVLLVRCCGSLTRRRALRAAITLVLLLACALPPAFAQAPPLVFTADVPEFASADPAGQAAAVVEERGLALWGGAAADFGVGASLSSARWTLRSITSLTAVPVGTHARPTFQQIEITRPVFSLHAVSVAGGGGVRQEWDGTRVLIGRVLAGAEVGRGQLQGSVVVERALSSPEKHDAADVVTSFGWSQRVGHRFSVGLEGIGQDLEGLWDPAEADGGARLLIGPSLHARSRTGNWGASFVAGPVVQTASTALASAPPGAAPPSQGHHFAVFASGTWAPSFRR
jgi:hypothetical protein